LFSPIGTDLLEFDRSGDWRMAIYPYVHIPTTP